MSCVHRTPGEVWIDNVVEFLPIDCLAAALSKFLANASPKSSSTTMHPPVFDARGANRFACADSRPHEKTSTETESEAS